MKLNLKVRALVFATFFVSCLIISLLVASLTTEYWVQANARRDNITESMGNIHFGLFSGQRNLNVKYGWRNRGLEITQLMVDEPDLLNYWLWLGTTLGVGFGILSSVIGAFASVLKAASASKKHGTVVLLMISNICSAISQIIAFVCWAVQFVEKLQHNTLPLENRGQMWTTKGMASLGHSFYFVVGGTVLALVNVTVLATAIRLERRYRRKLEPDYDEKTQGAIMLY